MVRFLAALALVAQPCVATESHANPIRKVVNMLQAVQKKVEAEGEKAQELYDAFMCYCKTSGGDLEASIKAAEEKIPTLASDLEAAQGKLKQLKSDLKAHKSDRASAKKAMAEATALREKEKKTFDKTLADMDANIAAVRKATAAIEEGMGGSFLQTSAAAALRSLIRSRESIAEGDRHELLSFLSGTQGGEYAPASGEIVGILKQMLDEMLADRKDLVATEDAAVKDYEALMAAKKKEVAALSKQIEVKLEREGELGIKIVNLKDDAGDLAETLEEDKKFVKDLKKNCAAKTGIHEKEMKARSEEVVALADTIKIVNDDDALDLFKKTLPSASSSFLQLERTSASMRAEASALLRSLRGSVQGGRHHVDFILLALSGKKVGFDKIVKLIDNLVATLKAEQDDDTDKQEYCTKKFDEADDEKKALKQSISDLKTVIEESKEGIATLTEEIAALKAGIVALDKQVAEATEQRKEESAEYKDLMQSNGAAKELLLFAKNRLNKFYNPKLYKAPPKRELSAGDQIYENNGGDIPTEAPGGIANTGVTAFLQVAKAAPPPPPATAAAFSKKAEESNGVIAMMDLLVADLDKEMTVAETEEKNAQEEYEETIKDAGDKRREDSKSLTDKEAAKAQLQGTLEKSVADKKSATQDLMGVEKVIMSLHGECDWLMKYYKVRKEARTTEIDALGKAKAVLSGADYSLLQARRSAKVFRHA